MVLLNFPIVLLLFFSDLLRSSFTFNCEWCMHAWPWPVQVMRDALQKTSR